MVRFTHIHIEGNNHIPSSISKNNIQSDYKQFMLTNANTQ